MFKIRYTYRKYKDKFSKNEDWEGTHFRRQPASILSTGKTNTTSRWVTSQTIMNETNASSKNNESRLYF